MKTLLTTCLFVALYAQASYAANDATLAEPSGRDIMLKNEEARKADQNEVATLTMTLVNKAGKTRSRTAHFTFDDSEPALRKTHFKFLSPKNVRGTAFVQLEHRERENDPNSTPFLIPYLRPQQIEKIHMHQRAALE